MFDDAGVPVATFSIVVALATVVNAHAVFVVAKPFF